MGGRAGVVKRVRNPRSFLGSGGLDDVEAAGVAGVLEAVFDDFVVEVDADAVEGGEGEGSVLELVGAVEAEGVSGEGFVDEIEWGALFVGFLLDDGAGFGGLGGGEDWFGGTDDACFFAGDFGEGVAEMFLVIKSDGGDDGDVGGDGGGGIEAAAHAGFEDEEFAVVFGEVFEGNGEGEFEEGGVVFPIFDQFAEGGEVADGVFFGDFSTGDADAFAEVDEVGGSEESGAAAGGAGHGVDEGADGAFAVGAGDVDDLGALRGEGEVFAKETARVVEAQLDSEELGGVEPVDGFLIGHWCGRTRELCMGEAGVVERIGNPRSLYLGMRWPRIWTSLEWRSLRWTMASMRPCWSMNSAVWKPGGRS